MDEKIKSEDVVNAENSAIATAEKAIKEAKKIVEETRVIEVKENKKNIKRNILISILIILLIALISLLSTIFGILNKNNNYILSDICINGIDVSGLTKSQAIEKVNKIVETKINQEVNLQYNEIDKIEVLGQFGLDYKVKQAVEQAYAIGRNNNIIISNYQVLSTLIGKNNVCMECEINDEKLDEIIKSINSEIPNSIKQYSYYIEENNLIITPGIDGLSINKENLKSEINKFALDFNENSIEIQLEVNNEKPNSIDVEKIYSEVYKDAQDAYITQNPFEIHSHVDGVDFAISIEEAKKIISENSTEYKIPLLITKASKTISDLGDEAFPDVLATYSTNYSTSSYNRKCNVQLAVQKINGYIVLPGETFSYNQVLGKRTIEAGFKEAGAYAGGTVVSAIGGGICQVSSTLYNSVLLSNLEVVARSNHSLLTGYVPVGRDATVSWGGPEFKFTNNRTYPIKIVATADGKTVKVSIYGVKQADDYDVEILSYRVSTIGAPIEYINDASIPQGTQIVSDNGSSGCISETYKILKRDGVEVSREFVSKDTYKGHKRVIRVGTGVVEAAPTQIQ